MTAHSHLPPMHMGSIHSRKDHNRMRELTPMFMIRFDPNAIAPKTETSSALAVARKCKKAIDQGMRQDLEVVFVNLSGSFDKELAQLRETHHLVTILDWANTLETIFAAGSDHCPKCGAKSFIYPVVYCAACGANPGIVFEQAGGLFETSST